MGHGYAMGLAFGPFLSIVGSKGRLVFYERKAAVYPGHLWDRPVVCCAGEPDCPWISLMTSVCPCDRMMPDRACTLPSLDAGQSLLHRWNLSLSFWVICCEQIEKSEEDYIPWMRSRWIPGTASGFAHNGRWTQALFLYLPEVKKALHGVWKSLRDHCWMTTKAWWRHQSHLWWRSRVWILKCRFLQSTLVSSFWNLHCCFHRKLVHVFTKIETSSVNLLITNSDKSLWFESPPNSHAVIL